MKKEELTDRYLRGLTTNHEEQQLAEMLSAADDHALRMLLDDRQPVEADEQWLTEDYTWAYERLLASPMAKPASLIRRLWPWVSTAAAIVFFGLFLASNRQRPADVPTTITASASADTLPTLVAQAKGGEDHSRYEENSRYEVRGTRYELSNTAHHPSPVTRPLGEGWGGVPKHYVQGLSDEQRSRYYVLTIVDGKEAPFPSDQLDHVETIVELTPEQATAIYGQRGQNGALIVNTKAYVAAGMPGEDSNQTAFQTAKTQAAQLIVVDGIIVPSHVHSIEEYAPDREIETCTLLTPETAVKTYGPQAVGGAVVYTTKKKKT